MVLDSHLLDDFCGRWERGYTFRFGVDPGKELKITSVEFKEVGILQLF